MKNKNEVVIDQNFVNNEFFGYGVKKFCDKVENGEIQAENFKFFPAKSVAEIASLSTDESLQKSKESDILALTFGEFEHNVEICRFYPNEAWDCLAMKQISKPKYAAVYKVNGKWQYIDKASTIKTTKLLELEEQGASQIIFFERKNLGHLAFVEMYTKDFEGDSNNFFYS